jgi:hypothetical protein
MRFFGYVTGFNIQICSPGTTIYIADFFTKALPKAKYDQLHRYIVVNAELLEGKLVTMEKTLWGKGVL